MDEFVSLVRNTSPRFNRINAIRLEYNMVAMSIRERCFMSFFGSRSRTYRLPIERGASAVSSQVVLHITFLLTLASDVVVHLVERQ